MRDMKDKNNLFDIMQNYKPTDDIFTNNATKEDIERVKFLVYQKKGKNYMKLKIIRRTAVAAAAALALLGSVAGVNAATHGAVVDGISKIFNIKIEKDANDEYSIDVPSDLSISIDENDNGKVTINGK